MRIAQIAPLAESVPPKLYGGTERVVAWLVDELVERGHEVSVFASGDSHVRGKLIPVLPQALRLGRPRIDPLSAYTFMLDEVSRRASDFDVIHAHIDWLHLPLLTKLGATFCTTLHGRLDLPGVSEIFRRFPRAPVVSISDDQRSPFPNANWLGTVYHGMPLHLHRPSLEPGSYLAFLGRISPEKNPEAAIAWARSAGKPLRIAAKLPQAEQRYFKERLEPLIDGDQIKLVGELTDDTKGEFLRNAIALLFPIDWPEPFGLVMIEAMACGTPVVAYRHGSVPEVIDDGITGYIVDSATAAVAAIQAASRLDRKRIRKRFEDRFSSSRMANDYLALYSKLESQSRTAK